MTLSQDKTTPMLTMLIVDDTSVNRILLRNIFRGQYTLLMAEDGQKALDTLRVQRVDVVILDIIMPVLDGFGVIEAMKADEKLKSIPVIVTTAERDLSERRALTMGADDFISKPFDSVVVERRVSNIVRMHILERAEMERQLREARRRGDMERHRAETDPLTGIGNRMAAMERTREALEDCEDKAQASALMIIDVDNFKLINDSLGHPAGDAFLCAAADALTQSVRSSDVVGRIGGDEFMVFLRAVGMPADACAKADQMIARVAKTRRTMGLDPQESLSIGIAYDERSQKTLDELYQLADRALYDAKKNGKGCFVIKSAQDE